MYLAQASTDSGHVQMFDVRREGRPVWTLGAHPARSGVNGMSLSSQCPGCLITVSADKTLKVRKVLEKWGNTYYCTVVVLYSGSYTFLHVKFFAYINCIRASNSHNENLPCSLFFPSRFGMLGAMMRRSPLLTAFWSDR